MDDEITLSTTELQVISELDSRLFGFVKLNEEQHARKKGIARKAIQYLERVVVQAHLQESRRKEEQKEERKGFVVDPKTYVKLGHLHLLLEDWSKALSAYQKYFRYWSFLSTHTKLAQAGEELLEGLRVPVWAGPRLLQVQLLPLGHHGLPAGPLYRPGLYKVNIFLKMVCQSINNFQSK